MPRYIVHCTTTRSYWLTVEAPNVEAAHTYYSGTEGDEFHAGEEDGWTLHEVEELPEGCDSPKRDVVVVDSGDEVKEK